MDKIIEKIKEEGIIAILRGLAEDKTLKTAKALFAGGIKLVEVTFSHKDGQQQVTARQIMNLSQNIEKDVSVGAGTVLCEDDVRMAADAGAKFIISPDSNEKVITLTKKLGLVSIPGAYTPTEVCRAYEMGADFVKIFPLGDDAVSYLKALRAPLSHIPMLAVGGVSEENIFDIFKCGISGVGMSSKLVSSKDVAGYSDADFINITHKAKRLRDLADVARGK